MRVKWTIAYTIDGNEYACNPLGEWTIKKEREGEEIFYRDKLNGKLIFRDSSDYQDYTFIMQGLVNKKYYTRLYVYCDGAWVLKWTGTFTRLNAKINEDKCQIEVTPVVEDEYTKILNRWENEYNVLNIDINVYDNAIAQYTPTLETTSVITSTDIHLSYLAGSGQNAYTHALSGAYPPVAGTYATLSGWTITKITHNNASIDVGNLKFLADTTCEFTREVIFSPYIGGTYTTPEDIQGYPWTDLGDVVIGGNTFRKFGRAAIPANLSTAQWVWQDYVTDSGLTVYGLTGQINWQFSNNINYPNGRYLYNIIAWLANQSDDTFPWTGGSYDITSQFFTNATNPITGITQHTNRLVVYQNTDVINYDFSNKATKLMMNFRDLMETLKAMFNVRWDIYNGKIRIEHISAYKQQTNQNDLTTVIYEQTGSSFVIYQNEYDYQLKEFPTDERITFKQSVNADFVGVPIFYEDTLTGDQQRSILHNANCITDIKMIIDSPSVISKDGWTMLSVNNLALVNIDAGSLSGIDYLNASLSVSNLQRYYWRYERPVSEFEMNGQTTAAQTLKRNKKQQDITVPLCCDEYDWANLFKTELGWGELLYAELNYVKEFVKLSLLYE